METAAALAWLSSQGAAMLTSLRSSTFQRFGVVSTVWLTSLAALHCLSHRPLTVKIQLAVSKPM